MTCAQCAANTCRKILFWGEQRLFVFQEFLKSTVALILFPPARALPVHPASLGTPKSHFFLCFFGISFGDQTFGVFVFSSVHGHRCPCWCGHCRPLGVRMDCVLKLSGIVLDTVLAMTLNFQTFILSWAYPPYHSAHFERVPFMNYGACIILFPYLVSVVIVFTTIHMIMHGSFIHSSINLVSF